MSASTCKTLLASLSLLGLLAGAGPAWAHGEEHHGHAAIKGDAPRSFASKPPLGTAATCPVSGERFIINKKTQMVTYKGRVYAFCCPDCKPDWDKDPDKYADKKK